MGSHDVSVEDCYLAAVFLQTRRQYLRGRRLTCGTQAGKPNTETLLVTWWMFFSYDLRDFFPCEPRWKIFAAIEIPLPSLASGDLCPAFLIRQCPNICITILIFEVNKLSEVEWLYAELILKALDQFLRRIWRIEWFTVRVISGARVITTNDHVVRTVVSPDERMPQRFFWTSQTHSQRKQCQQNSISFVVVFSECLVTSDTCEVIDVSGLCHAHHGMK